MMNPENYLTDADWRMLGDDSQTLNCKVNVLMDRMFLLGFLHPSEASVRQLAGLLAAMLRGYWSEAAGLLGPVEGAEDAVEAADLAQELREAQQSWQPHSLGAAPWVVNPARPAC